MELNQLGKGEFYKQACARETNPPDRTAFSRFLNGKNNSANVRRVIQSFLERKALWPEIRDMNINYPIIANFFSGNKPLPDEVVKFYSRRFRYYQHSTNQIGKVATSTLTINNSHPDVAEPTYLAVEERSADQHFTEIFRGVLFRNGESETILTRLDESNHSRNVYGPKMLFVLKKGKTELGLTWIGGRLLKTSGHERRHHQSNWFALQIDKDHGDHKILTEDEVRIEDAKAHEVLFETRFLDVNGGL